MMNKAALKEWVQHRINFWEDACERHRDTPIQTTSQHAFDEGVELGEEKGFLEGLYMVMEYIDGQRR